MKKTRIVTARLSEEIIKRLKEISEKEFLDTSAVIRKLLGSAIREWREDYAVEQYKKGEFSYGQVAEFIGISVWDVPELLKNKKVSFNYDEEELDADLKAIRWRKKR